MCEGEMWTLTLQWKKGRGCKILQPIWEWVGHSGTVEGFFFIVYGEKYSWHFKMCKKLYLRGRLWMKEINVLKTEKNETYEPFDKFSHLLGGQAILGAISHSYKTNSTNT